LDYIPDIDEMLMPAPFRLGTNAPKYKTQGHSFVIPAKPEVLQTLLNKQLNFPLGATQNDASDPWDITFGTARHRTCDDVSAPKKLRFTVGTDLYGIVLNILRYWRVDQEKQPKKGYIAYTETLLQFMVEREFEDAPDAPSEAFYFVAAVYIDDSEYEGELQDPHSLPILLGREAYGMPKNPGQISYCPNSLGNITGARLNIWDYSDDTIEKLALKPAITVDPDHWKPSKTCGEEPAVLEEGSNWGPLAAQFGIEERKLKLEESRDAEDPFVEQARILYLEDRQIVVHKDLYLFAKLIGLKQFPDPTSKLGANGTIGSCYRSVVESAVEYAETEKPVVHASMGPHTIQFHPRSRVQLHLALGIELDDEAELLVDVRDYNTHFTVSNFVYGRPCRTDVWEPS
jgi:hypothetical protein